MAAVVKGVLATALVQGVLAGGAYVVLGVPFALVLAAITALLSLLPVGGTALVWVPVAVQRVATRSPSAALRSTWYEI